jgi:hypothetical protein
MLRVPGPSGAIMNRRYTIRTADRTAATVTGDMVVHGDSPSAKLPLRTQHITPRTSKNGTPVRRILRWTAEEPAHRNGLNCGLLSGGGGFELPTFGL